MPFDTSKLRCASVGFLKRVARSASRTSGARTNSDKAALCASFGNCKSPKHSRSGRPDPRCRPSRHRRPSRATTLQPVTVQVPSSQLQHPRHCSSMKQRPGPAVARVRSHGAEARDQKNTRRDCARLSTKCKHQASSRLAGPRTAAPTTEAARVARRSRRRRPSERRRGCKVLLINAPTEVRRGMGVVREEPIEDESGNEERVTEARQKPARRMSVTARLVQAASKQVQGPLSRRKSRSSKQDPLECAEGDSEAQSALDSEEDEGITAWSSETTKVAVTRRVEARPVGDQKPQNVGNAAAKTASNQSAPSQPAPPPAHATSHGTTQRETQRETQSEMQRENYEGTTPRKLSASEDTLPTKTSPTGDIRRQGTSAGRPPVPSFRPLYTAGGGSLRLPTAACAPPVAKKWSPFGDPVVATVVEEPLKPMYELLRGVDDTVGDKEVQQDNVPKGAVSNAPEMSTDSLEPLAVPTLERQRHGVSNPRATTSQLQRDCVSNQATNNYSNLTEMERVPSEDEAGCIQRSEVQLRHAHSSFAKAISDERAEASYRGAQIGATKAVDSGEEGRVEVVEGSRDRQAIATDDTNVPRKGAMPNIRPVTEVRRLVFSATSPPESVGLPKWTNSVGGKSWRSASPRRAKRPTERRCFLPRP